MRNLPKKFLMVAALVLLSAGVAGCWGDSGLESSDDRIRGKGWLCLDRAKQENALYLRAIENILPAEDRATVSEWNGCDSANNGAALYVDLRPGLKWKIVRETFEKFGWSSELATEITKECGMSCDEVHLAKKVDQRVIGVAFEGPRVDGVSRGQSPGVSIMVHAVDMCWDDDGYRCP